MPDASTKSEPTSTLILDMRAMSLGKRWCIIKED